MAKILLVDDEPKLCRVLALVLEQANHRITVASTKDAALGQIAAISPDLVALDLRLGRDNGLDILRVVSLRELRIPVICITGYGTIPSAVECMRLGAFSYLTKPIDNDKLLASIHQALHRVGADKGECAVRGGLDSLHAASTSDVTRLRSASRLDRAGELTARLSQLAAQPLPDRDLVTAVIIDALTDPRCSVPTFVVCAEIFRRVIRADDEEVRHICEQGEQRLSRSDELVATVGQHAMRVIRKLTEQLESAPRIGVEEFARIVHMDRSHISRLLIRETGLTFRQWKWGALLRRALRQLVFEAEHIDQIAFECGHDHASQFDTDFQRLFGLTPTRFREVTKSSLDRSTNRVARARTRKE